MRTTLSIDDDVLVAARELAHAQGRSIGAVISDLARRGLESVRLDNASDLPVIRVPAGTKPITSRMVRRALNAD